MLLNYRYEFFPNKEQDKTLHRWVNLCCQQYNSALLDKQHAYKTSKKNLNKKQLSTILTDTKKVNLFLKEVPSQPLQQTLDRLADAYERFFKGQNKFPKLKKLKDYNSITFTQFGVQKRWQKYKGVPVLRLVRHAISLGRKGCLLISGLGEIPVKWHRKLDGPVNQVTIKRQGGRWFVIFTVEAPTNYVSKFLAQFTGIDVGIQKFAVLSNGMQIVNPKFLRQTEKKLKKAQKKLSRMKKGSNNYKKQVARIQKLHAKVANQRKDFLHKIAYHIAKRFKYVVIEDLKIKNMMKNRKLAKSIQDAGWGMFKDLLNYKCKKFGGELIKVAPHYTSINCSSCGEKVKKSLSVRTHVCPSCGFVADRDENAAINIEKKGAELIALSL